MNRDSAARSSPAERPALAEAYARAARAVARVLEGTSLNAALAAEPSAGRLRSAIQDLVYTTLRAHARGEALAQRLLERPIEDRKLYALLLVSLCELDARAAPAHTVVHQAVEAAGLLPAARARGLVNAVLRAYQRDTARLRREIEQHEPARYQHPQWWIERLRAAYPHAWEEVLRQGNAHPPMGLRVNRRRRSPQQYVEELARAGIGAIVCAGGAVVLERPCPVETLPGFARGEVSIQDAGAQRAAPLLEVREGMRVLDACAAPGGKTGHLLEIADCRLTAMDVSAERIGRIAQNLRRLGLAAEIVEGDALDAAGLLPGRAFERILLDAPCTASGVVRRHPDAKWLRRESDLAGFARLQSALLESLWRVLEPDGKLLYATCSLFPEENEEVVSGFQQRHPDARRVPLAGIDGGQILPGATSDGFYYALLHKRS